jgi:hypothetical protein
MIRNVVSAGLALALFFAAAASSAQSLEWPRELDIASGILTMYEPQTDELEGDRLFFRAAVSYKDDQGSEPVFGAAWFEARVEIDRDSRMVHLVELEVTETRFPEGAAHVQGELDKYIRDGLPNWDLDFSLDGLLTSLEASEEEIEAARNLKMDPPDILYRDHPALLIMIDGDPVMRDIENSSLQAVINTPYPLIKDGKRYYLNAARDVWYAAADIRGPWAFEPNPPREISGLIDPQEAGDPPEEKITRENAPEIVVSTGPAELIVTEGAPDFQPLVDDLLVLKNSQNDIFMHVSGQQYYIVLSGRWYRSTSLNGPWTFNPSDELPAAFVNIPQESPQADSRAFVAGTDEAREAVMDAQIPQTAAVEKGPVDIEVSYDGDPRFDGVEGTSLAYAVNTGSTVLKSGSNYYLVEDAVWYIASSPTGTWRVAENRPEGVESIPPESPVYNVKYVYIYESTPEVVYVGYTPGYTGSYVYHTTVVYGTGWYYRPWISPYYYYPRYATWGFHVTYNPWTGWGFGISWGWGPFRVGFHSGGYWHRHHHWHHRHGGPWGPGGYRPRPVHYGNVNINNININTGNIGSGNLDLRDNNLYRDKAQKANVAQTRDFRAGTQDLRSQAPAADRSARPAEGARPATGDLRTQAATRKEPRPSTAQNNVYTDRNGDVYRKTDGGWQKNDGGKWNNVSSAGSRDQGQPSQGTASRDRAAAYDTRNSGAYQRSGSGYSNPSSLDRQSHSRQRSNTRNQQYGGQRGRPSGGRRR